LGDGRATAIGEAGSFFGMLITPQYFLLLYVAPNLKNEKDN